MADKRMANNMVLVTITLLKKGNLQQCQNYWTISLISHPGSHAEDTAQLSEATSRKDNRCRAGRLPNRAQHNTEQIFNLRIICERYLQH